MRNRFVIVVAIAAAAGLLATFWPHEVASHASAPRQPAARSTPLSAGGREATSSREPAPPVGEKNAAVGRILERLRAWRLTADHREAIRELGDIVASMDAGSAREVMDALPPGEAEGRAGTLMLEKWLSLDPESAVAWLMDREAIPGEQATLVARKLLEVPGRFQSYLDGVKDESRRQQLLGSAGFEVVSTDPQQALIFAESMGPGEPRSALVRSSAFEWGRRDPEAARQWVEKIGDPDLRERLAAWGAKGCAERDAPQAAEWLVSAVKSPELLGEAVPAVVRCWAARDPAAATEWVSRFPEGPVRDQALENLVTWTDAGSGFSQPGKAR